MNSLKNFFLKYIKQFDEGTVFYSKETTVKNHIELYWWSSLKDQTYCLSLITLVNVDINNFSTFRLVDQIQKKRKTYFFIFKIKETNINNSRLLIIHVLDAYSEIQVENEAENGRDKKVEHLEEKDINQKEIFIKKGSQLKLKCELKKATEKPKFIFW